MTINLSSEIHNIEGVEFDTHIDQLSFLLEYAVKIVEQAERDVTRQLVLTSKDCRNNPELFHRAVMQKIRNNRASHDMSIAWLEMIKCLSLECDPNG
jgi:Na+/phosphate symporter